MFQPCAPLPALMEVPVCAGTSVCVFAAGQEQAATQVHCLWGSEGQVLHQINRVDSVQKHCLHQCVAQKMLL